MPDALLSASEEAARELILDWGWNSTCYQLLNDGIEHWWSADRRSMVGFVRASGMAVVAGAPVCAEAELEPTLEEWERYAAGENLTVCYFGAEARLQSRLADSPSHVRVVLGSQPEWEPGQFVAAIEKDASLRAQLNRARNKGVSVSEWSRERSERNPALEAVLYEWLATRGLPPLHFLVEPETLGDLRDRRLFVAERLGEPVGFVTLCPVPARRGWLTEQFVRSRSAPNGTVEFMLYTAAAAVAKDGSSYLTMGIVPLVSNDLALRSEPRWLRFLRSWARAHHSRFYDFKGLSDFKSKFHPEHWQPVVVIVRDRKFSWGHLRAIARAFTVGPPELAVARGLWKAVALESRRASEAMLRWWRPPSRSKHR